MIASCPIVVVLATFWVVRVAALFEGCDSVRNLTTGEAFTFQSANYSYTNINKRYEAGTSCRLQLIAPPGHFIRLSGRISLDRKPGVFTCIGQGQKFLVSRDGMNDFFHADIFCSLDTISLDSVSNEMTIGYISDKDGAGRFQAIAKAMRFTRENCDCGWGYHSFTKFTSSALFQGFTSVVGLYHMENDEIVCTGAIISSKYVIMAAHCLASVTDVKTAYQVLVGYDTYPSDDHPQYQQSYAIESVKIHEKYVKASASQANDIALIQTANNIRFNRGVSPICLPGPRTYAGENFYKIRFELVAWNKYNDDGQEQTIHNATVYSYANVNCASSFKNFTLDNTQLCTLMPNNSVKYPEYPGATLIYSHGDRKAIVGIFNMNVQHTQPVVYTRIGTFVQWIRDAIPNEFLCNRYTVV